MVKSYLSGEEKARILALREEKVTIKEISTRTGRSQASIKRLISASRNLPVGEIPKHKPITGRPRKTGKKTDDLIRREVMQNPSISSTEIKKRHSKLLENVSVRTVRHRLLHDLKLQSRRAAKKPLLTKHIKKKRVAFAKRHLHWTKKMWAATMFSDESSFKCIRNTANRVRRPYKSNRYDARYTVHFQDC